MKHILKQFEELGTHLKRDEFTKATLILTAKYSALIFTLLFLVSILVYVVFSLQLGITIGDGPLAGIFEDDSAFHEESESLLEALIFVNMIVWFLASIFSYFLALTTLRPIQEIHIKQEKFVADVAHELRTPLTVMKSGAETVLRIERSSHEYKEFITDSLEEVERITTLSNDLLTLLAYKKTGLKNIESVDFSALIQVHSKKIKQYALAKEISITENIQSNVFVSGVSNDLARLLLNVLKNAVDYNKKKGSIQITLTQESDYVTLVIADTGIGMSDVDIMHVCDRFYKADTARAQSDSTGSGLGLSIVREIIDFHKGTLEIQSDIQKGSVFTIRLPCV